MNKFESHRFQRTLEDHRVEALQLLNRWGQEARGFDSDSPQDIGDLSITSTSKESLFQRSSGIRKLVRLIDSALQRIKDGAFGACVSCGDEISFRRLEAVPWTEYCLRCQEILENGEEFGSESGTRSYSNWRRAS
jgi:RNA polymerase-binding protein DksA